MRNRNSLRRRAAAIPTRPGAGGFAVAGTRRPAAPLFYNMTAPDFNTCRGRVQVMRPFSQNGTAPQPDQPAPQRFEACKIAPSADDTLATLSKAKSSDNPTPDARAAIVWGRTHARLFIGSRKPSEQGNIGKEQPWFSGPEFLWRGKTYSFERVRNLIGGHATQTSARVVQSSSSL